MHYYLRGFFIYMKELQVFQNADVQLRTVMIDGEPWFVAADVCAALGIVNNRDAMTRLRDSEKGVASTDTLSTVSKTQDMLIINEPGLYRLIMRSDKPAAAAFQDWVVTEVLPAIRKTGKYAIETKPLTPMEIVLHQVQATVDLERKQSSMQLEIVELKAELTDIKHRTASTQGEFFTIMGYASLIGRKIDANAAASLGKKATAESKAQGIPNGKILDSRYGMVNTYHRDILEVVF